MSWARRSTAGSSPSSRTRLSAPSSSARRSRRCSAHGDGSWAAALRAAVLLGENGRERAHASERCAAWEKASRDAEAVDLVRRALVETLSRGDRRRARRGARRVAARCPRRRRRAGSRTRSRADSDLAHLRQRRAATVDAVETERAILEGLERIDGLRREDAPAGRAPRSRCARCSRTRRTGCERIRPCRLASRRRSSAREPRSQRANRARNRPRDAVDQKTPGNWGESCSTPTFCCTMDACRTARTPVEVGDSLWG